MRSNVARAKRKIFNDFFFLFVPLWGDFGSLGFSNEKRFAHKEKVEGYEAFIKVQVVGKMVLVIQQR